MLRICCSVFPTIGDKIRLRYLDSSYVVEPTKLTMGLKGIFSLWIFGSPYILGVFPSIVFNHLYDLSPNFCFLDDKSAFKLFIVPKHVIPACKQTGVIYAIPCKDCETKYIGETGRSLETRQKEHQRSVRLAKTKDSALAEHVYDNNHSIDLNESKNLLQMRTMEEHCQVL